MECETLVGAEPEPDRKDAVKKSSVPNDTAENDHKESAAGAEALKDESTAKAAEKHAVETALDEESEKDDLHDSQADHQEFQEWQNDHAAVKGQKTGGISSETTSSDTAAAAKTDSWRDELIHIFQENGSHDPQADMAFLQELCKTVKLSNMSLMHNVLEYHFGQTAGNAIYPVSYTHLDVYKRQVHLLSCFPSAFVQRGRDRGRYNDRYQTALVPAGLCNIKDISLRSLSVPLYRSD